MRDRCLFGKSIKWLLLMIGKSIKWLPLMIPILAVGGSAVLDPRVVISIAVVGVYIVIGYGIFYLFYEHWIR